MDPSKDRNNWITVAEVIRLIKEPVALYTSHIVNKLHNEVSSRLPSGRCTNPAVCLKTKNHGDLCIICKGWYDELAQYHKNKDRRQIRWRENCDTSKWPIDPWEVAKYFMPVLGDNKMTIKDSKSTDLSSLLNVLAWMKDAVFAPDRRLDHDLVTKLRSEVRNPWAHAPNQKLSEAGLNNAFDIANKLMGDLEKVFGCNEVTKCMKDMVSLQNNGLTNVAESKLNSLNLLANELGANVRTLEKKLETLEVFVNNKGNYELKSCIPDKLPVFIGREKEREEIISSIVESGWGIVCIVGGPGFGKSSLAVQVSHDLRNKHDSVVIFSFLSNSSTLSDVIQRLCNDVGANPGDDPESSLMFRLKSVEKKVVLVMDNIEQLLEGDVKSRFIELVLTLRKNSRQLLQILTTSRIEFSTPDQATKNHRILELDKKSSVELLRRCYTNEEIEEEACEDTYLSELADLCGYVPIALCIAGTLIPSLDDPLELVERLREKPMETLQNSVHCVKKAIEFSFQRLGHEDQKAFVRLSGFKGNFERKSAEEVVEKKEFETHFLQNLVTRSLLQRSSDKRFVIHSLIRRFLANCDKFQDEKAIAQGLMVAHFLRRCHLLTMDSYSEYNGFANAREKFRKDVHNFEETLKICSHIQASDLKPDVLNSLTCSDIYNFSSRFFLNFSWDLLPVTVLKKFFDTCIQVAESRNQPIIQIAFQNLVAGQEGRKFGWTSSIYTNRMKLIQEIFHNIDAPLTEDRLLLMYAYDFYAHYDCSDIKENPLLDLSEKVVAPLSDIKYLSPVEKATELQILNQRGFMYKRYATKDKKKSERYTTCAKTCFTLALSTAETYLGDHELTCTIQKKLGDMYFTWHGNKEALSYYSEAIQLRMKLELDSNDQFVLLLKNCGSCLSYLQRSEEAVDMLKKAVAIADKLDEKHTVSRARVRCQLARAYRNWSPYYYQEAAVFAKEAMEMKELLNMREVEELKKIIAHAENRHASMKAWARESFNGGRSVQKR